MRRWNSTTWVLAGLAAVALLIGGDLTRRALFPARERGAQAGDAVKSPTDTWEPRVGEAAQDFALPDNARQVHHLTEFKGKGDVVLTFFCGCSACHDMAKQLAEMYQKKPERAPTTVSVFT